MSELRIRWRDRSQRPSPPVEEVVSQQPAGDRVQQAMRGLFGRDSLYMLTWASQVVFAAGLTPVTTRVMASTEFGLVTAATAVMQALFVIAGLGLHSAIQRHYAGRDGAVQARRLLMLTVVVAAISTVLVDTAGPFWTPYLGFESYGGALRLSVYWAGVSAVTNASLALLRSQDRLLVFAIVSFTQSVVTQGCSLLFVAFLRPTATMFVLAQLSVQVVATAVALCFAPPKLIRPRDSKLVRAALVYALPLVPGALSTFVLVAVDRLIVQAVLGPVAVGRYQIAYNVGNMPILLLGLLSAAWMPRIFALHARAERTAVLVASRDALYRLLTPVIVGLSIGSSLVLHLWAPPTYRPDELLLVTAVVIVGAVPYTASLTATRALLSEGRTSTIAAANGAAAVVNVVLNLILIPHYELIGAAAATFLSYEVLRRLLMWRTAALLPRRSGSRLRLLEIGVAAAVALAGAALPTSGVYLVVRGVLSAISLVWFGWILIEVTGRRLVHKKARARASGQG